MTDRQWPFAPGKMDMFGNELMKAEENEEDMNELNDVTFGDSVAIDEEGWEWEKEHEKMAESLTGGGLLDRLLKHSSDHQNDDDDDGLDLDENDLKNKLSQLVIDDEEDEDIISRSNLTRKPVDLEELFGPSSPPGLFPADELVTGIPNIWGSPIREGRMMEEVGGLKSLLRSLQKSSSTMEGGYSTTMQGTKGYSVDLPRNAKTLEEIEQELIRGSGTKTCWKLEEIERALTVEDVERELRTRQNQVPADGVGHVNQRPGASPVLPAVDLPSSVTHPLMKIPPHLNQVLPTMPGVTPLSRSPFPVHGYSRSGPIPLTVLSPLPGQRPPGVDIRHWNPGSNAVMPMMSPHLSANNLNYILASRAAGFALGPNRPMLPRLPGFPHPGLNHLQNRNHRNDQPMLHHQPSLRSRGPPSAAILNQHYLLQHQQQFQQQQMLRRQPGYHGNAGWMPVESCLPSMVRHETETVDEYAGLMQQREKEWIIKIQLLQLQTDNPYVDDYYFTCWSIKKILKEKQKMEGMLEKDKGRGEPTLVLPQLAKVETKAYAPVQFEGSLGRLTASSIHNPRQIIDFHLSTSNEHEDGQHLERKRFKEILLEIEKGYDVLLDVDDIEKKALAQPSEAQSSLHHQRQSLIKGLYERICSPTEEGDNPTSTHLGLSSLLSIHKGLLLAIRLLPLLEKVDSEAFCCSLLRKLPLIMKKDWQEEDWPRFYHAIARVIQTANLETLVRFASEMSEEACSKNRLNSVVSVVQNKLGISLVLALVCRGEVVYSTHSPLDLEANEQQKWREFIELVADALENLDKDMLQHPLEQLKNIADHFLRFLDKRQHLAIEDKIDFFTLFQV